MCAFWAPLIFMLSQTFDFTVSSLQFNFSVPKAPRLDPPLVPTRDRANESHAVIVSLITYFSIVQGSIFLEFSSWIEPLLFSPLVRNFVHLPRSRWPSFKRFIDLWLDLRLQLIVQSYLSNLNKNSCNVLLFVAFSLLLEHATGILLLMLLVGRRLALIIILLESQIYVTLADVLHIQTYSNTNFDINSLINLIFLEVLTIIAK